MADDENELLALLGNGSIRGSDHERGRVGESWEQAQALPRLSPLFWTKGASVGMFVELRHVRPPAVSRTLAAAFCPVGRKSLPTKLEAIMPKREETARPTQKARIICKLCPLDVDGGGTT